MNSYEQGKKARRIASVVYLLIMTIIMGGTYLSQQQKEAAGRTMQNSPDRQTIAILHQGQYQPS